MARPLVPDTTAIIAIIRNPDLWPAFAQQLQRGRFWLSSVVVAELLAGTRDQREAQLVNTMVHAAHGVSPESRLLVPNHVEWELAGRLLARRMRLHGTIRPRDHLADVLILLTAARLGGEVITANIRHFQAWRQLARAAGLDVTVSEPVV